MPTDNTNSSSTVAVWKGQATKHMHRYVCTFTVSVCMSYVYVVQLMLSATPRLCNHLGGNIGLVLCVISRHSGF